MIYGTVFEIFPTKTDEGTHVLRIGAHHPDGFSYAYVIDPVLVIGQRIWSQGKKIYYNNDRNDVLIVGNTFSMKERSEWYPPYGMTESFELDDE